MSENNPRLIVDIVSDPVCPWCFVGIKSWGRARQLLARDFEVITRFRPYQLNPDTPLSGTDRLAYYAKKFPDKAFLDKMITQLIAAAKEAGEAFDPMSAKWLPNTLNAHRVKRWAHFQGLQEQLSDRLYTAFWKENADLGDAEALAKIAGDSGMDRERVLKDLNSDKDMALVRGEADSFRKAGVSGVPTFIINEQHGFSGAQSPENLVKTIKQAASIG